MIENSRITGKREALSIINDSRLSPDTKDELLQEIVTWSENYGIILMDMYPRLRRSELRIDYTVRNFDNKASRELIHTDPHLLSLDEMYRVARYYEPGSEEYLWVFEIAARHYPDDTVANINAAAALLQQGHADAAWSYLEKAGENRDSYINLGTYWYITGDMGKAVKYFNMAQEAGITQARRNLILIGAAK